MKKRYMKVRQVLIMITIRMANMHIHQPHEPHATKPLIMMPNIGVNTIANRQLMQVSMYLHSKKLDTMPIIMIITIIIDIEYICKIQ